MINETKVSSGMTETGEIILVCKKCQAKYLREILYQEHRFNKLKCKRKFIL